MGSVGEGGEESYIYVLCINCSMSLSHLRFLGTYLAVGAADVKVTVVKEWADLTLSKDVFSAHTKSVHAVAWGPLASFLVSASADRSVKVYG